MHITPNLSRDRDVSKREKTLFGKINVRQDDKGLLFFDLSYLKKNRIPGPYLNGAQGDHTVCYSIFIASLERRISNKTLAQLIPCIATNSQNPTHPTLHNDLMILFYLYAKVVGRGHDFYLRDRLQRLHKASNELLSDMYKLDVDSNNDVIFSDGGFAQVITNYLLHYVYLFQYLPFSTSYAKPMEGSGYRGEGSAKQFIEKLEGFSPRLEQECIDKFSKLLDQKAISNLLLKSPHFSLEIVAYQLILLLGILDGYPKVKEFFFGQNTNQNLSLTVSRAKFANLAAVIFQEKENEKQILIIESALQLIARLRRGIWHFEFLKG